MNFHTASAVLLAASCLAVHSAEPLTPVDLAEPPADVERIELYLLLGQSNMKGRVAVPANQALNPRIAMLHLRNDQWYLARHPLHLVGDPVTFKGSGNEGVGPGLAFAQAMLAREPHALIGLVPCAVGGSRLALWMKGGRLYENAVRRARLALAVKSSVPVVLKGALWLQGEADAKPELQPTYQDRLARMIDALRADLAEPNLPFIAATIGEFSDTASSSPSDKALINNALLALPQVRPHTACVDARDLKDYIGDHVHYSTASANIIGERLAAKYWELQQTSATAPARPNILFILSDDHSLQTIGAYGARLSEFCREQNVTPNIDRLASQGGLFVNSFCANSLCAPSRAAILTGLHAHANGVTTIVRQKPIPATMWNYQKGLREAGYQTALFGKWHLLAPPDTGFALPLVGQGRYWNAIFVGPNGKQIHAGYVADVITDMAIDWLKHRDESKPFMLAIQHKSPHRPWMPPPRYYGWLQDVQIPEPSTLFDDYSGRSSSARKQKMEIGRDMNLPDDLKVLQPGNSGAGFNGMTDAQRAEWVKAFSSRNEAFLNANLQGDALTRWKYQEFMKDYLRCVKSVDDSVGRLTAELKAEGLDSNTVVIYSSDQGFYNGEHGWFDKRWIYEESIHMPFIIRWPGVVKPGTRFSEFIQNIDYAETFVDIAGGKVPAGLHGKSLVPILRGETPADWRKSVYYHFYETASHNVAKHYGVRNGQYTLAYFYQTDEWELYDLQKDPQQLHSVYAEPAYAQVVVEMKAELKRLRQQFKDSDDLEVRARSVSSTPSIGKKAGL